MSSYVIKIELPQSEKTSAAVANSNSSGSTGGGSSSKDESLTAQDIVKGVNKIVAATGIKRIADSFINYEISTISLRTGATEREQKANFLYSEISQGVSSLAAIGMGALVGGPAGAAAALIGVSTNYLMKFINYAQNYDKLQLEKQLEDVSIAMAKGRAGVSGSRSSKQ